MKLEFATAKDFEEQGREMKKDRQRLKQGADSDYRKQKKIFNNDYRHMFSTGMPFGGGK